MPPYQATPAGNNPAGFLLSGVPEYAYGSRPTNTPTVRMQITGLSLTSNVATLDVTVLEGNIPAVGSLISVAGVANNGGAFNVANVALASVAIDKITGIGTVTLPLTHADVVQAAAAGQAYVLVPDIPEAVVAGSSKAFAVPDAAGFNQNGRTVTWSTEITGVSGITVKLEGSIVDEEDQYTEIDSSTNTTGETRYVTLLNMRFLRLNTSGITGSGTIIGIISI